MYDNLDLLNSRINLRYMYAQTYTESILKNADVKLTKQGKQLWLSLETRVTTT